MTGTATQNAIGRRRRVIHHMGVYEATLAGPGHGVMQSSLPSAPLRPHRQQTPGNCWKPARVPKIRMRHAGPFISTARF
jgi:hypothetical protein